MENKRTWNGSKVLTVAISLLVACAIWLFVDNLDGGTLKTKVFSDIPIEYLYEDTTLADRGLMLLPDSDQTVTLELKARRFVLAKIDPDKIRIQVDLSNVTGTGTQRIEYSVWYPNGTQNSVSTVSATPHMARVNIGELYSRDVDIRCAVEGSLADGYIAGELQYQPATLEIRGQKEDVDKVAYAKATLQVDNATETITKMLDYQLYDAGDQLIEDTDRLHAVADQIQVTLPVNVVKELPLKINFIEVPGAAVENLEYTISPASVTVSGDAALLKHVQSIVLDDFDLSEFSKPTTYNYAIPLPEGCENLSGATRATLTVRFKDITSATLIATNFTCENVPEGKTVTVLTSELPVELRGTTADVAAVTAENVTVVANLTDVSSASGSYTVPATVKVDTAGNVGVLGTYQIRVTISDGEEPTVDEPPAEPET